MVDETKCGSSVDGTTTDEDRDVRVDSGGSDEEELCMDEEDEDDQVSPTSAPGALTFGISRLLAGGGHDEQSAAAARRAASAGAAAAAAVSGPAEALASLYAAGHHAAVFGLHHHLHQQQQQHMQAAAAAVAAKPDDKTSAAAAAYLHYSGAAGVIKVPAHRPHPSAPGGGAPGSLPSSPWAAAAIDPVSFMQRNAFLFAADKNRLAAGKCYFCHFNTVAFLQKLLLRFSPFRDII